MARGEVATHGSIEGSVQGAAQDALFELGLMYCAGREVGLDLIEAHKWFNLAALRGNADAKRKRSQRRSLLKKAGVDLVELTNIDFVDAALCALTAQYVASGGRCVCYGDANTGYIIVPEGLRP